MLRAAICIAVCRAHGGSVDDALDSAVAIELLHNAFMIHDDIEDDSLVRRGRPTLHAQHGVPIALNVGDALSFLSLAPLLDNARRLGHETAWRIMRECIDVVARTVEGQAIELGWMHDDEFDITERDYLKMVLLKTCWYTTILPCRVGAIAANARVGHGDFVRFGTYFGSSFQIRDDVLNLEGVVEHYGKEIGGDIHEGKRTLMLIHLLRTCSPEERAEVIEVYRRPRGERTERETSRVIDLMRAHGSIDHAAAGSNGLAGAALAAFDHHFGTLTDSDDKRFVRALVVHLAERLR
jgi:geranylgeranyl diphosphate synthase, type II